MRRVLLLMVVALTCVFGGARVAHADWQALQFNSYQDCRDSGNDWATCQDGSENGDDPNACVDFGLNCPNDPPIEIVYGCTDSAALNYNPNANTPDPNNPCVYAPPQLNPPYATATPISCELENPAFGWAEPNGSNGPYGDYSAGGFLHCWGGNGSINTAMSITLTKNGEGVGEWQIYSPNSPDLWFPLGVAVYYCRYNAAASNTWGAFAVTVATDAFGEQWGDTIGLGSETGTPWCD